MALGLLIMSGLLKSVAEDIFKEYMELLRRGKKRSTQGFHGVEEQIIILFTRYYGRWKLIHFTDQKLYKNWLIKRT